MIDPDRNDIPAHHFALAGKNGGAAGCGGGADLALYVDSLPAPVIEALERIAAQRAGREHTKRQPCLVK
jgi:hypothetical protein